MGGMRMEAAGTEERKSRLDVPAPWYSVLL